MNLVFEDLVDMREFEDESPGVKVLGAEAEATSNSVEAIDGYG
ncbi:ubiquitin carboxyl-terminal hydrolase family protein [Actinidia rufa]|uniref:Ubiquitin carboxyl-terminal hydrolase family protein n=1 Tax=Actinidia rufa TaxID=165716 RepID=A0A7J0E7Q2_9ERIC|nr:ubiquitin carboxyl-terminal hydrolase family protein [Actinidia rufa]